MHGDPHSLAIAIKFKKRKGLGSDSSGPSDDRLDFSQDLIDAVKAGDPGRVDKALEAWSLCREADGDHGDEGDEDGADDSPSEDDDDWAAGND